LIHGKELICINEQGATIQNCKFSTCNVQPTKSGTIPILKTNFKHSCIGALNGTRMEKQHARRKKQATTHENSNWNEQVRKYRHSVTILVCSLAFV
jgi:hypothetical protein